MSLYLVACLLQATDYQVDHAVSLYFAQAGEGGLSNVPQQTDEQLAQSLSQGHGQGAGYVALF